MTARRPLPLDAEEVARRVSGGEGVQLELKRGLPGDEKLARLFAAFANTRGGLLAVGIDDHGELVGAPRPDETMAELERVAAERVVPGLELDVGVVALDGKRVVACLIGRSRDGPRRARLDDGSLETSVRTGSRTRAGTGPSLARTPGAPGERPLDALDQAVLAWCAGPGAGPATAGAFATAHGVPGRRAALAFRRLEREGYLAGSGAGPDRRYALPRGTRA